MLDNYWRANDFRDQPKSLRAVLLNKHLISDVRVVERCLRKHPRSYVLHSMLADLLWKSGRKKEALKAWQKSVRLFPRSAAPFFQRAAWEIESKNYLEAQNQLRLCLRRDSGDFGEPAYLWRAECLYRLGRYKASISQLKHVSRVDESFQFPDCDGRSKSDLLKDIEQALYSRRNERRKAGG